MTTFDIMILTSIVISGSLLILISFCTFSIALFAVAECVLSKFKISLRVSVCEFWHWFEDV